MTHNSPNTCPDELCCASFGKYVPDEKCGDQLGCNVTTNLVITIRPIAVTTNLIVKAVTNKLV